MTKEVTGFATRLKEARNRAGFTQKELAERTFVGYSTICRYEQENQENKSPLAVNLVRLAQALDVTAEFLLFGEEKMDIYMDPLKEELFKLTASEIADYHKKPFSGKVLSHLCLSDDFVEKVQKKWSVKKYTKAYVFETIMRYASNRPSSVKRVSR